MSDSFEFNEDDFKEAQIQLRRTDKSLHDFKAALDEHAIVAITDAKGLITYVNDKFCDISQYSKQELVGKDHRILNSRLHPKSFFKNLWQTIKSGQVFRGEICNKRKDGTLYWVDTTIVPFLSGSGKPEQYIAIRADITERKLYEKQLKEMANELDHKNKELETVIYAASHDLRSPLVNVQGFSSLIKEQVSELNEIFKKASQGELPSEKLVEEVSAELQQAVDFINAGATKMDALLSGLLAISRVGRARVEIIPRDVNEIVQMNLDAMNYQLTQAKADVVVHELLRSRADKDLLGQIFSNLFENALKYASPDRYLRLDVYSEKKDGMIHYHVKDNGVGIAGQNQQKIFDLFHRLDPTESDGHGIGLAIVKSAAMRMQGAVEVHSEKGVGSTFTVKLPVAT